MERIAISLDEALAREFDALTTERGVRHGQIDIVSVEIASSAHSHGYRPRGGVTHLHHMHLKPKD